MGAKNYAAKIIFIIILSLSNTLYSTRQRPLLLTTTIHTWFSTNTSESFILQEKEAVTMTVNQTIKTRAHKQYSAILYPRTCHKKKLFFFLKVRHFQSLKESFSIDKVTKE